MTSRQRGRMPRGRTSTGSALSMADGFCQHAHEKQNHNEQKRTSLDGGEPYLALAAGGGRLGAGARRAVFLTGRVHVLHGTLNGNRVQLRKSRKRLKIARISLDGESGAIL